MQSGAGSISDLDEGHVSAAGGREIAGQWPAQQWSQTSLVANSSDVIRIYRAAPLPANPDMMFIYVHCLC